MDLESVVNRPSPHEASSGEDKSIATKPAALLRGAGRHFQTAAMGQQGASIMHRLTEVEAGACLRQYGPNAIQEARADTYGSRGTSSEISGSDLTH